MKCPQCTSNLNLKDAVPTPRLGTARLSVCAFCGSYVAVREAGGEPRLLDACISCGAPHLESEPDTAFECRPCRPGGAHERGDEELAGELGARFLREAMRLYPPVEASEASAYFSHVLGGIEGTARSERGSFKLLPVFELGFRALSLPGGTILAGESLLCALDDEACLAFVLAREIAHQQSGRVGRRFRGRRSPGAFASGLEWGLGILTWGVFSPGRADADLLREVACLGYGPVGEQEADEWATKLLGTAGYDPAAAVRYLSLVEKRHLEARGVLAAFLDVHPVRSRRRCLVETLVALQRTSTSSMRLNKEVYRRAVASLRQEKAALRAGRLVPMVEPAVRR